MGEADVNEGMVVRVFGVPRPMPRGRAVVAAGGARGARVVSMLRDSPAARWKRLVLSAVGEAMEGRETVPKGEPVRLRLLVLVPTKDRKRWGRYRATVQAGDADNYAKLVMDAMTVRGVWADDGQVAVLEVTQVWSAPERAGCVVEVECLFGGVVEGLGLV